MRSTPLAVCASLLLWGCASDVESVSLVVRENALSGPSGGGADVQLSQDGVRMLDPEFDPLTNRFVYCQPDDTVQNTGPGKLYVGAFAPDGTLSRRPDPVDDCLFLGNGPEWGRDRYGSVVVYMKQDPATLESFIAYIRPRTSGLLGWDPGTPIQPSAPLDTPNVVYASRSVSQETALVMFMSQGNLVVEDLNGGNSRTVLNARGNFPHFSDYDASVVYTRGYKVCSYDVATGNTTDLPVTSATQKSTASSWIDPIAGKVFGYLEAGEDGLEKTYKVHKLDGTLVKSLVTKEADGVTPAAAPFSSLERFVYKGNSYLYYRIVTGIGNADLHIVNTNTGADKKVSGSQTIARFEPEIGFPSGAPPILFFAAASATGEPSAIWRTPTFDLPMGEP